MANDWQEVARPEGNRPTTMRLHLFPSLAYVYEGQVLLGGSGKSY